MILKPVTVFYFQIVPKYVGSSFSKQEIRTILEKLDEAEFPLSESSTKSISLHGNIEKRNTYFLGTAIHNRKKDIDPTYDDLNKIITPQNMKDSEGLAKATHFLIDPRANVLVIENVAGGVKAPTLCTFLRKGLGCQAIEPALMINPRQLQDFHKMTSIFRFQVKIAKVEGGNVFDSPGGQSSKQLTKAADNSDADLLNVVMEVNSDTKKNRGSLAKATISSMLNDFLNYRNTSELETLKVRGLDGDDGREIDLDFIEAKLKDTFEIEKEPKIISKFDSQQHYEQIIQAYERRRRDIINLYGGFQ